MIQFLFKGLLRDKHRSLLPIIVVAVGVMLTVVFHSWLTGVLGDSIEFNARFTTGHVKVITKAYAENIDQIPNDLALMGVDTLMEKLRTSFPDMDWVERIQFAGVIDVPDSTGEPRAQGTIIGFGIDLLSGDSREIDRMNIRNAVRKGHLPEKERDVLLSDAISQKLNIHIGDTISIIGSTMYGEMAVYNFILAGTVEFGMQAMDKGSIIADIGDIRKALNMENATGEILGFFKGGFFESEKATQLASYFISNDVNNDFSPVMKSLKELNSMGIMVDFSNKMFGFMILVFLIAMSIVLWNAGLLGGLRRYGEFGMRLAIGESKGHVYKTMIYESLLIGIMGSIAGITIGLLIAWYMQAVGINIGNMMRGSTILMPSIMRAHITPETWYIGFIPGVFSTFIGTMLSGIGIYKRQTAQLFKELES